MPNYPDFPCHLAPLPPGKAPKDGCECRVCQHFVPKGFRWVGDKLLPVLDKKPQ